MSKLRWRALFSHTDLRLTAKLPMEMVEKSTEGRWQGCSTELCPKVFHKEVVAEFVVTDGTKFCVRKRTSDRKLHHPLQSG